MANTQAKERYGALDLAIASKAKATQSKRTGKPVLFLSKLNLKPIKFSNTGPNTNQLAM